MTKNSASGPVLVVGAGPVGLSAAVELVRRGVETHIIEMRDQPSQLSRAVGIMPRSLEYLEPSGATERFLDRGVRIRGFKIYSEEKQIAFINASIVDHRFNFVIAMAQSETEQILEGILKEAGVTVERSTRLVGLKNLDNKVSVELLSNNKSESRNYNAVLGADGIYSSVRYYSRIPFDGIDYDARWSIADYFFDDWQYEPEFGHIFLKKTGIGGIIVRLDHGNRYRIAATLPGGGPAAINVLPKAYTSYRLIVGGDFAISARQAKQYNRGSVYLAGDAAHVHPPVGGQGMNLGIADAWRFANYFAEGNLIRYASESQAHARKIISNAKIEHQVVSVSNRILISVRNSLLNFLTSPKSLQKSISTQFMGIVKP